MYDAFISTCLAATMICLLWFFVFATVVKPGILESPQPQNVSVGEVIVLQCTADGNPVPTVTWSHNGQVLIEESGKINITAVAENFTINSTLTIYDAVLTDTGSYVCSLESPNQSMSTNSTPVIVLVQGE